MTWTDWKEWAVKQRKRTPWNLVLAVAPPWTDYLDLIEAENRQKIDEMVQLYAQRRRWPKMTELQRCLLYYRMENAERFVCALSKSFFPAPQEENFSEAVEWLLITSWQVAGNDLWLQYRDYCRLVEKTYPLKSRSSMPLNPEDGFAM